MRLELVVARIMTRWSPARCVSIGALLVTAAGCASARPGIGLSPAQIVATVTTYEGHDAVVVTVRGAQDPLLGSVPVPRVDLASALQAIVERRPQLGIYLRAEPQSSYEEVAAILALAKDATGHSISFAP